MSFPKLLDAALAGTQRQEPPAAVDSLADASRESRLLRGASIEGLRRLAGQRLVGSAVETGTPAPPEIFAVPPPAAVARLAALIEHGDDLLVEWLELARARGYRVPHLWLVDLLDIAREDRRVLSLLEALGGERAAWLGVQNPAWAFAARIDPFEAFFEGTPEQRARALRLIRGSEPARARAMLSESWQSESADARTMLLAVLEEGLEAADEPLLQRAISDPRKEVREVALRLIRRLPESSFGQRWAERAQRIVVVKKGFLGASIEVREPADFDPTWGADGAEPRPPKGFGKAGWWLRQMMALTPPSTWPEASLKLMRGSDWSSVLVPGLAEAATTYRHAAWCEALLIVWTSAGLGRGQLGIDPQSMVSALPTARTEAVLRRICDIDARAFATLLHGVRPWSEAFGRFVLERLPDVADQVSYGLGGLVETVALCADPTLLPLAVALAQRQPDQHAYGQLVETLEYRSILRRELG